MSDLVLYTLADRPFYCTQQQAEVLDNLRCLRAGGIGRVYGYKPSTDWAVVPTVDLQILTRFSTEKLYQRKREALDAITFADVKEAIAKTPKLAVLTEAKQEEIFNERKAMEIASLSKTLEGDREDAHRQGHDRCYIHIEKGVKVNLVGEKDDAGLMQPVLHNGFPMAKSVMLMVLELRRTYVKEGVRKVVNSGAPVLMGNAIGSLLNKRSVGIMALSLKADNFDRMVCDSTEITADDLKSLDATPDQYRILLEAAGFEFV